MKKSARTNTSLDDIINEIVDELVERSKKSRENKGKKTAWQADQAPGSGPKKREDRLRRGRRNASVMGGIRQADPRDTFASTRIGHRDDRRHIFPGGWGETEPKRDTRSRSDYRRRSGYELGHLGKSKSGIYPRSGDPLQHKSDILKGREVRPGVVTKIPTMTAGGYRAVTRSARTMAGSDNVKATPQVTRHLRGQPPRYRGGLTGFLGGFQTQRNAPREPPRVPLHPDRLPGPAAPNPARDGELPSQAKEVLTTGGRVERGGRYYDSNGEYKGSVRNSRWIPAAEDPLMYEIRLMEKMEKRGYGRKLMTDVMRHHIKTRCG
jgi:hypothetical protein